MFLSWKLDKFTLFTHSLVGWNLENLYKRAVPSFFRLADVLNEKKPFLESIFITKRVFISGYANTCTGKKFSSCLNIALLEKYCYFVVHKQFICKR